MSAGHEVPEQPAGPADGAVTGGRTPGRPVGRRVMLGVLGLGAAGVVWGSEAQKAVGRALRPVALRPVSSAAGGGMAALFPGGNTFRLYSVTGSFPSKAPADYRLAVAGMVERPLVLGLDDLSAMPATHLVADFQCVTGWRVPKVSWTGVRVADLLDRAGVSPGARALSFSSFDGVYTESLTLDQARRDDVMVAYRFEGQPLSREHGGPARLYVAPMYGYKSCKWLSGIQVVDRVKPGYWEQQGYTVDGWVGASNGRNDAPT